MANVVGKAVGGMGGRCCCGPLNSFGNCSGGVGFHCCDGGMVATPGAVVDLAKTRGVPSMGSTNYGPRGQAQSFRDAEGFSGFSGLWMTSDH